LYKPPHLYRATYLDTAQTDSDCAVYNGLIALLHGVARPWVLAASGYVFVQSVRPVRGD